MYKEYESINIPDSNVEIWRYMDFTKFVSLLEKKALFFVSVDKLTDKFEGFYPVRNVQNIVSSSPHVNVGQFKLAHAKLMRRCTAVNCWHINKFESAAMWNIYLKGSDGVAVKSSFERLRDSLDACSESVGIGMVEYVDYQSERISERSSLGPCLCKRKSYEYERELRAIFQKLPDNILSEHLDKGPIEIEEMTDSFQSSHGLFDEKLGGMYISVQLEKLIDRIYVNPGSPEWFYELVKSVMDKYGISKKVIKSKLDGNYNLY